LNGSRREIINSWIQGVDNSLDPHLRPPMYRQSTGISESHVPQQVTPSPYIHRSMPGAFCESEMLEFTDEDSMKFICPSAMEDGHSMDPQELHRVEELRGRRDSF